MNLRILSIGALSRNECLPHDGGGRTPHATTTLLEADDRKLLTDPALPGQVLSARLNEQAGLRPEAITDIFLTTFRPAHRHGLDAFPNARIWISEREREAVGGLLVARFQKEQEEGAGEDVLNLLREEIALLKRTQAAPDTLLPGVDLFPLPGYSAGTCGLLIDWGENSCLVAGDAVATQDHLQQKRALQGAENREQALASLSEAIEIADWIIPGHGNWLPNPHKQGLGAMFGLGS